MEKQIVGSGAPLLLHKRRLQWRRLSAWTLVVLVLAYILLLLSPLSSFSVDLTSLISSSCHPSGNNALMTHRLNILDTGGSSKVSECGFGSAQEDPVPPLKEIIEVAPPLPYYGKPVASQTVLVHSFGNSWGKPARAEYIPPATLPNTTFNKVVLNLTTTVNGVQYDRLAHLYLSDVPLWRTSTAEPGNKNVVFSAAKDVSEYLVLFQKPGSVVFQLDNLLNRKLSGVFNVNLTAYYYDSEHIEPGEINDGSDILQVLQSPGKKADGSSSSSSSISDELINIFNVTRGPASKIIPVVTSSSNSAGTPLRYLPNDKFEYDIQPLSHKTISAKLRLFISGNAAEEYWYSNVIDENAHKFDYYGHHLLGKGPVRHVKVYLNDVLVALESPKPVIFTGGISPALWSPVVGINAFDLGHIDVNLGAYLPLLWARGNKLRVEVVTGGQKSSLSMGRSRNGELPFDKLSKEKPLAVSESNDDDGKFANGKKPNKDKYNRVPLQNWIAAGSLLLWENKNVTFSSGIVPQKPVHSQKEFIISTSKNPAKLVQFIAHSEALEAYSQLELSTADGSDKVKFALNHTYSVNTVNVQKYEDFADIEDIASFVTSTGNLVLSEVDNGKSMAQSTSSGAERDAGKLSNLGKGKAQEIANIKRYNLCKDKPSGAIFNTGLDEGINNGNNNNVIGEIEIKRKYATVIGLNASVIDAPSGKVALNASVVQLDRYARLFGARKAQSSSSSSSSDQNANGKGLRISKIQNGTSTYSITPEGNYGFGSTDTEVKVKNDATAGGADDGQFSRKVSAVNGTIVNDVVNGPANTSYIHTNDNTGSDVQKKNLAQDDEFLAAAVGAELGREKYRISEGEMDQLVNFYCANDFDFDVDFDFLDMFYV